MSNLYLVSPRHMAQLVNMVADGTISRETAREILDGLIALGLLRLMPGMVFLKVTP